jgi:serine/threonine protein kinase
MINHEYGPKSEVWSFGVLVYELLHGYAPLSHCKDEQTLRDTIFLPPTFREGISYELKKLI